MTKLNLKYGLVALAGLGLSANVSATDLTCDDITFTPEAFATYEFADKACLGMVERDGDVYAKSTATKVEPDRGVAPVLPLIFVSSTMTDRQVRDTNQSCQEAIS